MRPRATFVVLSLVCLVAGIARAADATQPSEITGRIDAVTVYRGQALVTRLVDVPGPAGLQEVVVTGLPEQIIADSLFAESDPGVEVRSVRFRTRPVSQDVREDVRKLESQIRDVQDEAAANARAQQVNQERGGFLDKLEQFTAPTANAELTRGVLNADTLKTLALFIFDQRQALAQSDLKLTKDARDIGEHLTFLQRQLAELTAGSSKTVREAVVFANFTQAGGRLRIKYLVDSASWSPSYVARAGDGNGNRPVTVQYNASIQQMSGEDWSDVVMTLSTATPSMVATAPELDPLAITLTAGEPMGSRASGGGGGFGGAGRDSFDTQKSALYSQRALLESSRGGSNSFGNTANAAPTLAPNASTPGQVMDQLANNGGTLQQDTELNSVAGQLQILELVAKDAGNRDRAGRKPMLDEGVTVTYQLPARTSLPSRSDQQSIQIATAQMTGDFYKLAMPVLTSYVYDQATVANQSKMVLLAGPVASYFNDQYVGTGALPTVAVGEQFTLGFGIDSSLRASRELVDKTESIQGGNRVMNFEYRLAVENFGSAPATVRLVDRLPTSKNQDVKITPGPMDVEASTQPVGPIAANSAKHRAGILNWSVDVAPQAMGEKATTVNYSYKLEFDKQLTIAGVAER